MTRWETLRGEVQAIGKWLVLALVWMRDQFTYLRAEHIRSVAFLYICWQGERSWRRIPDDATMADPMFILTALCLGAAIGLAWQATSAKIAIAGFQAQLGQAPNAAHAGFAEDFSQARGAITRPGVDDPE